MGAKEMHDMDKFYDVIIVGGGPAGLTAAIYLSRAKYRTLVIEKQQFGGQITITHEIVNYPGVGMASGKELTDTMYHQAEAFGAEFLMAKVTSLELEQDVKIIHTSSGDYKALGVLLATGAHPRMVGFKGEKEFKGRGVAYCATCDGEFFTGKEVFVIGGGFAAAEESIFLTKFASHVTILIRGKDFSCAETIAQQAKKHEKITVITDTIVEEVSGESVLNYIRYKNQTTGELTEYRAKEGDFFGVFVFVGYEPETSLVKDMANLNEKGYIITDKSQKTSIDGLYAAGDICIKPLRQVVTATSDGALAATELEKYVSKMQKKTGLYPKEPILKKKDMVKSKIKEGNDYFSNKTDNFVKESNTNNSINDSSYERINAEKEYENKLFTKEMQAQLETVFERMEHPLILKLFLDDRPISNELKEYMENLADLTDKLSIEIVNETSEFPPCVKLYDNNNKYTGLAFHGVPGGHEFTSFVLSLYNSAGKGQFMEEEIRKRILCLKKKIEIKILVSLSCTMCPELVIAVQHIATVAENIIAEVYDIHHFEELKNKYHVMSVPCVVINDEHVFFGKKNMKEVVEILEHLE